MDKVKMIKGAIERNVAVTKVQAFKEKGFKVMKEEKAKKSTAAAKKSTAAAVDEKENGEEV